jgi:hypothetical protein
VGPWSAWADAYNVTVLEEKAAEHDVAPRWKEVFRWTRRGLSSQTIMKLCGKGFAPFSKHIQDGKYVVRQRRTQRCREGGRTSTGCHRSRYWNAHLNGLEATRQILKNQPDTKVLVLSVYESEQLVEEVLDAGARGYVVESDASRDLVRAIEELHEITHSSRRELVNWCWRPISQTGSRQDERWQQPSHPRERELFNCWLRGRVLKRSRWHSTLA